MPGATYFRTGSSELYLTRNASSRRRRRTSPAPRGCGQAIPRPAAASGRRSTRPRPQVETSLTGRHLQAVLTELGRPVPGSWCESVSEETIGRPRRAEDPEEPPSGSVRPESAAFRIRWPKRTRSPTLSIHFQYSRPASLLTGLPRQDLTTQTPPRSRSGCNRVQRLDVAEQVFGQRAAVGVARKAAFGPREVRSLQRGPEDDEGIQVLAHPGRMGRERPQLKHVRMSSV